MTNVKMKKVWLLSVLCGAASCAGPAGPTPSDDRAVVGPAPTAAPLADRTPPQLPVGPADTARSKEAIATDRLRSLADRDGKPNVALFVSTAGADGTVGDRLAFIRDQFQTLLKGDLARVVNVVELPGLDVATATDLTAGPTRDRLAAAQVDEAVVIRLKSDLDGKLVGAADWVSVRDPAKPPAEICSVPIAQGWRLSEQDQWENLKYSLPSKGTELFAVLGGRYADSWEKRPFTTFSVVGTLDQPDVEWVRKTLAGRMAPDSVSVVRRKDPKTGDDVTQFRVEGTTDPVLTFGRLQAQKPNLELLEADRTHAVFTVTRHPLWWELTDPNGDPEIRRRVTHLPVAHDTVAVLIDTPGLNGGRDPQPAAAGTELRAVGGVPVSTIINSLGDQLASSCEAQVVNPGATAANLKTLLSKRELAMTQQYNFAWVVTPHKTDDNTGRSELGLLLIDLRSGANLGSAAWPPPASQAQAVDQTDPAMVSRYLTGTMLERMMSADRRKSVMTAYFKGASFDETARLVQSIKASKLDVEVTRFDTNDGIGWMNLYYAATDPEQVISLVKSVAGTKYQVTDSGPAVVHLSRAAGPMTVDTASTAVLVGVNQDWKPLDGSNAAPVVDAVAPVSAMSGLLMGACQMDTKRIFTFSTGGRDPKGSQIKELLAKPASGQLSLFYFTGHVRTTEVDGDHVWNLIPSDFTPGSDQMQRLMKISDLIEQVSRSGAKEKVVLLDCYLTPGEQSPASSLVEAVERAGAARNVSVLVLSHSVSDRDVRSIPERLQTVLSLSARKSLTAAELIGQVEGVDDVNFGRFVSTTPSEVKFAVASGSDENN